MATSTDSRLAVLLQASSDGDQAAFAQLYDLTASRVYGLVLRILRDGAQAEEVVQEVYLQLWQQAGRFDPARGTALTWVMTHAHRKTVDRVRSSEATRRRDTAHAADAVRDVATPFDETAAAVQASMDAQDVRAAMTTLSSPQREAIELAYFGGHTYSEVAQLLQVPLGTIKTRIRVGLARLREALSTSPELA